MYARIRTRDLSADVLGRFPAAPLPGVAAGEGDTWWRILDDEDGPLLPRHPDVGRVNTDQETVDELCCYAESGEAKRYDSLVDDYRSPSNGRVQWHWSLVERLRPNPAVAGHRHDEVEAGRRAAEPLLMELRAAGFPAYDLGDFVRQKLPSKQAAEIFVK